MPNVVDSLIVTLGLDATNFKKGQREVSDAWQKARGTQLKHARDTEDSNRKLLESFNKLKVEALGFFAALVGAREIKEFVANITSANAAVGRLAANIGEGPQMLQAWGKALERVGGNQEDAAASLTRISKAFYDLKYNGTALPKEVYQLFAMAGRPVPSQADSLDTFLNKTAGALKELATHDRTAAFFFGEGMGLSDSMVNLMIQYGDATSKYVASLKGLGATDKQIKDSQKLLEAWNKLSQTAVQIGNDIQDWFSPAFTKTLEWVQSVFDRIHAATSYTDPSQLSPAKQALRHDLGLDRYDKQDGKGGGTTANGEDVTKSNPLPVQVVPGPGQTSTGSGQSWWDWLTGGGSGSAGAGSGGGSAAPAAPTAPSPEGGRAGAMHRSQRPTGVPHPSGVPEDTRNWWQRHAPESLGGQPEPGGSAGGAGASGGRQGNRTAPGLVGGVPDGANATSIASRLMRDYGLTREQAIGATGVMGYESGNFQTMQEIGHSGTGSGWGYAQWTGSRRTAFMNWATAHNLDPSSDAANYGFLQHELATNYAHVIPRMKRETTVAGSARAFEETFEGMREGGPGIPNFPGHIARAEKYNRELPNPLGGGQRAPAWWSGVPGLENRAPGPQASLSTLHAVHPVTTSSSSNTTHINGGIHVNAPQATDADGIASAIQKSLGRYNMAMSGQSGQV